MAMEMRLCALKKETKKKREKKKKKKKRRKRTTRSNPFQSKIIPGVLEASAWAASKLVG
jgi:hypothetical protein